MTPKIELADIDNDDIVLLIDGMPKVRISSYTGGILDGATKGIIKTIFFRDNLRQAFDAGFQFGQDTSVRASYNPTPDTYEFRYQKFLEELK